MLDEIIETSNQMRRLELENLSMFGRKSFRVVHLVVSCLYYLFFRKFRSESIGNVFMMLESVDLNGGKNPISSPHWLSSMIKEGLRSIVVYYLYDLIDSSLDYIFTMAKANSRTERERALENYPHVDSDYLKNSFHVRNFVSVEKIERAKEFQQFIEELKLNLANILTSLALSVQTNAKSKKKKKINESLAVLIEKSKKTFKELMNTEDAVATWMFKYNCFALLKAESTEQVKTLIDEIEHLAVSISTLNRELLSLFKPALEDLGSAVKEIVGQPTIVKPVEKVERKKRKKKERNLTTATNGLEETETRKTKKNNLEKLIEEYEQKLKDLESHCISLNNKIDSPPKTDSLLNPFYRKESGLTDKLRSIQSKHDQL
ncbi:predicted protein [Naegleria gruberi]|uniref:Predicted protein n=1 Tax=Naegleria gruberi TaxID=5762 RepID=D2VZY2_NAEGR|nr:uncharacterized protein NAEGRDRAFT_74660 [Naegleria gruberi]EFC37646.1 predicted protein [Naegleria gruberi]|eukprot:XP_002670390.1 predicted protein [Naegleria gruberi strain NEG-M]